MKYAYAFATRPFQSTLFITTQCSLLKSLREAVLLEFGARKKIASSKEFLCFLLSDMESPVIYQSHFPFVLDARNLKAKFDA